MSRFVNAGRRKTRVGKGYLKDELIVLVQALQICQHSLQNLFRALAW